MKQSRKPPRGDASPGQAGLVPSDAVARSWAAIVGPGGLPESSKLDLVGRMGGEDYTMTRETFSLKRPDRR